MQSAGSPLAVAKRPSVPKKQALFPTARAAATNREATSTTRSGEASGAPRGDPGIARLDIGNAGRAQIFAVEPVAKFRLEDLKRGRVPAVQFQQRVDPLALDGGSTLDEFLARCLWLSHDAGLLDAACFAELANAEMSLVSRIFFAAPCLATSSIAMPTSSVEVIIFGITIFKSGRSKPVAV